MKHSEKLSTESYKGVRDFYPEDQAILSYLTATMRDTVKRFGYAEYSASILEPAELYRGKTSEEIVNEQTYTFTDRGGREVTLRPEMTPTVARMVAARRRELAFPLRWFSIPNVFRYERPQRGRLREHWQLNVDLFGVKELFAEVEMIHIASELMKAFGATSDDFSIRINSRRALNRLFGEYGLSEDGQRKLRRLIDRKDTMDDFDERAKTLLGRPFVFTEEEDPEVVFVRKELAKLGIENTVFDPSLVRGFDYYTGVVFEVFDTNSNNNRALFGGGRYDNLLELFGSDRIPAVGFGMGDVTIRDFLEVRGRIPAYASPARVSIVTAAESAIPYALDLAKGLRAQGVSSAVNLTDRKLGDQIKTADKHKVPYVLFVGDKEITTGSFTVRDLASGIEKVLTREELDSFFLHVG